jgi:hypothetical protein
VAWQAHLQTLLISFQQAHAALIHAFLLSGMLKLITIVLLLCLRGKENKYCWSSELLLSLQAHGIVI